MGWVFKIAVVFGVSACLLASSADAANKFLEQAIQEYNAGNYSEAIGLLGEAEPTEFNNPVLHYYLANAFSKTNQKTDAIREYKIALALEPEGQVAQYCERALRVLRGVPPALPNASVGKSRLSSMPLKSTTDLLSIKQTPRLIAILCGCPLCRRIEPTLRELETKYGDRVAFSRSMQNSIDPEIKQIVQDYGITRCPTVLLFDTEGHLVKQKDGQIGEADLRHDTETLASSILPTQLRNPIDERLSKFRETVVKEAETRVSDDQKRVDEEIRMIQNEETMQMQDISRHSYSRSDEITQIREDANRKIDALKRDMERRKLETFAAAKARIDALSSTSGGRATGGESLSGQH